MLRLSGGSVRAGDDTTRSPTTISPSLGSTKPAISRSVVVFPQPEGPSRHTRSPCSVLSDTASTTASAPSPLVRPRNSTATTLHPLPYSSLSNPTATTSPPRPSPPPHTAPRAPP